MHNIRLFYNRNPKIKKGIGVCCIVLGLLALVTPFTPGSWLIFVGLEFLGFRLVFIERIQKIIQNHYQSISISYMIKIIVGCVLVIVLAASYYLISPIWRMKAVYDSSPIEIQTQVTGSTNPSASPRVSARIVAIAPFVKHEHDVKGKALIIEEGTKKILRFEDFETINGPDVRVYLSTDLTNTDYVEVSPLKATKGNINYELPSLVDTAKYHNVLIWCQDFSVLFSSATF